MKHLRPILLSALFATACNAPPLARGVDDGHATPASTSEVSPYTLGPNDLLRVVVFGHPELSTHELGERIDFLGRLNLPLLGPVPVAGQEPDLARDIIRGELESFLRRPRVTLSVIEHSARRFYVFGEVESPGSFPLDRPLTALQALTSSGGFRDGADRKKIALLRGGPDDLEVHFFNAATPGVDGLFAVQPNDFIFVRQGAAGTFRDQVLPVIQSLVPPITALASLVIAAETLSD